MITKLYTEVDGNWRLFTTIEHDPVEVGEDILHEPETLEDMFKMRDAGLAPGTCKLRVSKIEKGRNEQRVLVRQLRRKK